MLAPAQETASQPVTPDARYFHTQRPVTVTNAGQSCAPLDAAAYAHAAPSLADLRLYASGREVPYALHTSDSASSAPAAIQPAILNLGQRGAHIAFDVSMNAPGASVPSASTPSYSDLELQVSATDFIATVAVSGGQSASGPATRLGTYTLFDLTGQKLGRSTILHLPSSNFPWLHFDVIGPLKPENITGVSIPKVSTRKELLTVVGSASTATQKGRSTIFTVDIPGNVPVTRIEFLPPSVPVNFSRAVMVQSAPAPGATASENENTIPAATSGTLSRIHMLHNGDRIDDERLDMVTFEQTAYASNRRWTITIDNGDDPPIAWSAVRLEMRQTSLCFDAVAGVSNYTLMYGDSALSAPHYDYAALFQAEDKAAPATLGLEQPNPVYQSRPDRRPFTEQHPALLWFALVLVVLTLGGVALRSGKRMQSK